MYTCKKCNMLLDDSVRTCPGCGNELTLFQDEVTDLEERAKEIELYNINALYFKRKTTLKVFDLTCAILDVLFLWLFFKTDIIAFAGLGLMFGVLGLCGMKITKGHDCPNCGEFMGKYLFEDICPYCKMHFKR